MAGPTRTYDTEAEVAAARVEIAEGRADEAVARMKALIAATGPNRANMYWHAAALGAAGDWPAHEAALEEARLLHSFELIQRAGGDLVRIQRDRDYAEMVGNKFYRADNVVVAAAAYRCAAQARAATPSVPLSLGLALMHQGQAEAAAAVFERACELFPRLAALRSFLLYSLFYVKDGVNRHAAEARRWRAMLAPFPKPAPFYNNALAGRPLRIGYVLPHLKGQARQFLLPVLEHHDPARTNIYLYLNEDLDGRPETVRNIARMDDASAVNRIRADKIDVLVDAWGHTAGGRMSLFARRAAPVQVSWLNYVQTTGVPEIDYLIHADCMDAPGAQDQCAESIWRIGPVISPFRPDPRPDPTPTPARANGFVTFASYNHPARLNDQTLDAWAAILRRVPNSKLILRYSYFADEVLRHVIFTRFAARGVDPERILFRGKAAQPEYYQSYAEVDIALDPSPTPGGTTSCDAVANGVPVLTLSGPDYFSRIGVAVVGPLGLDELVTHSWDEYIDRAASLAGDIDALDALRARTRAAFDASDRRDEAGFTRKLEETFTAMFNRWLATRGVIAA